MPSAAQGITSRTGTTLSSEDGATRGSRGQGNRANRQRGVSGCLRRNSRSPGTYGPTDIVADSPPKSDRKSTRLNSSHTVISYAVFCLKKKKNRIIHVSTGQWVSKLRLASNRARRSHS